MFRQDYALLLAVRPGLTDCASLAFCDEAKLLGAAENPEEEYVTRILPRKVALSTYYVGNISIWLDLKLIALTLRSIVS